CKLLANTFSKYFQLKEFDKNFTPRQTTREHLEDIEFDILTVENILENLPNKNSNSPDDIPYILLKSCSKILSPTITEIFRIILDNRTIPEIWRQSYIIPIFKKGEINDPANYRPISVTCTLCRVFERIISTQIINFLNKTKFFSDEQFGFLQYRSTTTNLLSMLDDFYKSLEKRENIDVIYIDFAKAFDSVPIELLLLKIKACGINGKLYDFIENFLTKRSFKVKIEKEFSESIQTKSGVPQGSVLGPLLFLIFINDLPNYLPSDVKIKIYADDVKLYTYHQNDNRRDILR
uniref:Reverse transcriptase domain-containing protein n=2 Tax=Meloidogyne TaxID=189290 RepID=A0A914N089_MELIC